jgi:MSHA biogenesis protein MshP
MKPYRCRRQAGFALVSGIFILVILATLGAFMVSVSGFQHTSSTLDVLGSRAYHAARSGIEWGAYQVTDGASGTPFAIACVTAPNSQVIAMAGTMAAFTVTVDCDAFVTTEAGVTVTLYQITSTASHGDINTATYVERQMQATIGR